jgi:Protein of unknown function (DUF3592)
VLYSESTVSSRNVQIDAATLGAVNRAFGVVGLLVGLALLFGGAYFVHHAHLDEFLGLIAKSQTAEGTVIENRPVASARTVPHTSYQAIVAFADQNGRPVMLPDQIAFSPPSFRVDQKVRVFYDPQNPQHAMIDRGRKNFIIPGICLVFGGLIVLGSIQRLTRALPVDSSGASVKKTFRIG